jgi:hypothetical protein
MLLLQCRRGSEDHNSTARCGKTIFLKGRKGWDGDALIKFLLDQSKVLILKKDSY